MPDLGIPVLTPTLTTAAGSGATIVAAGVTHGFAFSSLAIPVIGAAIAGVSLAVTLWLNRLGPKQKVATTKVVNEAEGLLKQYKAAWDSSDKNEAEKQQYLQDFLSIWQQVVNACEQDSMGEPGHRCIEDRMPNGMVIQANGNTYTGNGKWNWWDYYYYPVFNYQPPSQGIGQGVSNLTQGFMDTVSGLSGPLQIGLIGLLIIGGIMFMMPEGRH